jgi:histone deacetylase 1/2
LVTSNAKEIDVLHMQNTWDLVLHQPRMNVIDCKWVYKLKKNSDGEVSRHKAKLVARGFLQQPRVDMFETFSPVLNHTTLRTILVIAITKGWNLHQFDVESAFLHGELKETIYMK